jgi:Vps4 C terminal oligomerisation domain
MSNALLVLLQAVDKINPSVSKADIKRHEGWLNEFGSL